MNEFERALVYSMGGTFRLDLFDDEGKPTGLKFAGDVSAFSPSVSGEPVQRKAHTRGDDGSPAYNALLATMDAERTMEFSVTIASHTDELFAAFFFGEAEPLSQAAGAVAAVDVTVTALDVWLPIGGHRFIESVTASKSGTEVDATEYSLSPRLGMIMFRSGGTVAKDDVVAVTPTLAALTSASAVNMMSRKSLSGSMAIDLFNRVPGQSREVVMDLRKVTLTPDGSFDLMSAEFVDMQFKLAIEWDTAINPATNKPYGYGSFVMGNHPRG